MRPVPFTFCYGHQMPQELALANACLRCSAGKSMASAGLTGIPLRDALVRSGADAEPLAVWPLGGIYPHRLKNKQVAGELLVL